MRILQRFIFGEVSYAGSLDNRMRELITITVLTVNQTLPQLKAHVGACLNVGLTPEEIREAVYQCAPFVGFPKTLNAIAAMNETFAERGHFSAPCRRAGGGRADEVRTGACRTGADLRQRDRRAVRLAARGVFAVRSEVADRALLCGFFSAKRLGPKGARASHRGHARRDGRRGNAGTFPTFSVQCARETPRKRWSARSATPCRTWAFPGCSTPSTAARTCFPKGNDQRQSLPHRRTGQVRQRTQKKRRE